MKKFVAVIGKRNSGKSTVINSLSGCPTRTFRGMIVDLSTNKKIFVIASSPQEQKLSLIKFKNHLTRVKNDRLCQGIVIAIQPSKTTVRLSLREIVSEVQNTRAFNIHLFVLDPAYKNPSKPSSVISNVNFHLRGLRLNHRVLDGRRFAFLNAREINIISHLL